MTQTYQTSFKTVLAANLAVADTTATLATPPTVTKGRMLLKNGNIQEWISFTWVSGNTITGLTRWLSQTADPATGWTGLAWWAGTQIILVAMHDQLPDKLEPTAFTQAITTPDISFTGTTTAGLKVKSLTTAQRDAISNAANGDIIYNSTTWVMNQYIGGAWTTFATGTIANATTSVAGKVQTDVAPAWTPTALITDNPKYDALAGAGGSPSSSNLYETQYDTSNGSTKTATTISFAAGTKTISDSGNWFVTAGFKQGTQITITGSASNNGTFTIVSVAAGAIVIAESLVNESAGATVIMTTVSADKLVRYDSTGSIPGSPSYYWNWQDGNATIASGTTTLTRDMFYNNLTLQTGAILESAGFMIFVAWTLTQEGTGYIRNNGWNGGNWGTGWNGSNGVNGTAGAGGAAWAAAAGGTLPASIAWVAGGAGGAGGQWAGSNASAWTNWIAATNALGSNWVTGSLVGGGGGDASASGGTWWAYGSLATVTASKSKIVDYNAARNFACFLSGTLTQFWNNAGNASGGGGGGWAGNNNGTGGDGRGGGGGGGGGSGWNGWAVVVFAKTIVTASNTLLQAKWWAGGNGWNGWNGGGGSTQFGVGGGGGGSKWLGGNGGIIVLVYKTLSAGSIVTDVTAGAAGTTNGSGGTWAGPGSNGTAATSTTTTEVAGQSITIII